jgi:anti-sigma regulatory factor (Ser/Thr protein kinase)
MVSLEDFINWLADKQEDCTVSEMMSTDLITVHTTDPLVDVVRKLERHGFGRLPVIERSTGALVGIITKGDVIEKLLDRMDSELREEEIRQYRTSKFFEDIVADKCTLNFNYFIHKKKIEDGGNVASSLRKTLKRLGVNPTTVRKAAILMYEAEMNVIIYAEVGWVTVTVDPEVIIIEIADKGPGIPDIAQAMEPGYSTAPEWVRELGFGAGMGLTNIKQCAATLDIDSDIGAGTTLKATLPTEIQHAS